MPLSSGKTRARVLLTGLNKLHVHLFPNCELRHACLRGCEGYSSNLKSLLKCIEGETLTRLWSLYSHNHPVPSTGGCHFRLPLASPFFCLACHLRILFEDESSRGSGFGFQGRHGHHVSVICPLLRENSHGSSPSPGFCFRATGTNIPVVYPPAVQRQPFP